jgi:DnaJ-domain-containing protein 1
MENHAMTEYHCDRLTAKVMDKLAEKASDQYGAIHAMDLNPSITAHHTLRHALVRAAYMLGALEMQQSERERWTEAVMGELDGNGQAQAIVAYATRA